MNTPNDGCQKCGRPCNGYTCNECFIEHNCSQLGMADDSKTFIDLDFWMQECRKSTFGAKHPLRARRSRVHRNWQHYEKQDGRE